MSRLWIALLSVPVWLGCSTMGGGSSDRGSSPAKPGAAGAERSTTAASRPTHATYSLTGFHVHEAGDGPLWVFRPGSTAEQEFFASGEPAKNATLIGEGPGGRSIRGDDIDVLRSYALAWRYRHPGFDVFGGEDGRLWVFAHGGKAVREFLDKGEPAKSVTLIGEGPDGRSLRGDDPEVPRSFAAGWRYARPGFTVFGSEGRLWVFRDGSGGIDEYVTTGEPAKSVTLIAEGPEGMTLRGEDKEALQDYAASFRWARPGYAVYGSEGRLWVFLEGSEAHHEFLASGEPAKSVTLIGVGPEGKTLRGADREVLESYAAPWRYGLSGYAVYSSEGRLWVFREGSEAQAEFLASGEPAKSVTLVAAGPDGKTLRGDDKQVLEDFCASHRYATPGFAVFSVEGRLWVFREGSDALREYLAAGEPAKSVTLIGAGPDGTTLRGADRDVLSAFVTAWSTRS